MQNIGRSIWVSFASILLLSGCATTPLQHVLMPTHHTVSLGQPKKPLAPADLPAFKPGDQVYFTNGRREKVDSVIDEQVVWRTSVTGRKTRLPNFILPTIKWNNSKYFGSQTSNTAADTLWPLTVGNKAYFRTQITSTNKETGAVYNGVRDWRCEVDSMERIALLSGDFDTFKVVCVRTGDFGRSGNFRQESIWYYATEIDQPVLKLNRYSSAKRSPSRYEVMAYQPSMRGFGKEARKTYWKYFRDTMEKIPSGTNNVWRDKKSGNKVVLTPLKTLKQDDGTFCRQYRVIVSEKGTNRQGAGIACRDKRGGWRIPKRIDPDSGVSFRD